MVDGVSFSRSDGTTAYAPLRNFFAEVKYLLGEAVVS